MQNSVFTNLHDKLKTKVKGDNNFITWKMLLTKNYVFN